MSGPLPLGPGDDGEAVRDLQRRLGRLGYDVGEPSGRFGSGTEAAVRTFQRDRGLDDDGRCGPQTWSAVVEAGYRLGDRLLYLRAPMLRGDDVAELQLRLGQLGFDAGRVDGILGPETERALRDFQRNSALTTDGVCGRDTLGALLRLRSPGDHATSVMGVREREVLLEAPRRLEGRRVVLAEPGGLDALVTGLARHLQELGAVVVTVQHPDPSEQARQANEFGAEVFLALGILEEPVCRASYFATEGFESSGGRGLAIRVVDELRPLLGGAPCGAEGKRLAVLRETRMPAVVCRLGPASRLVTHASELVDALATALRRWVEDPI